MRILRLLFVLVVASVFTLPVHAAKERYQDAYTEAKEAEQLGDMAKADSETLKAMRLFLEDYPR